MTPEMYEFVSLDLPAVLAGTLAAVTCGLLGNYLVLRRQALMGDAISHAVLPGLVGAFLVTGSRSSLPMFAGAAAAGLATVGLIGVLRKLTRIEAGAAMGVVFSIMFALGVLLLEQAAARSVDLDADCVLNGQLETIFWFPPETWGELLSIRTIGLLPRQVVTLGVAALISTVFVVVFFKELRLAAFDPDLATALGFNANLLNGAMMTLVAVAVVASFEAVGSILVIAMLICPAATARFLTDRLRTQVLLSVAFAGAAGVGGYALAATAPRWLPVEKALSAAGMMTVASGALFAAAMLLSPTHGVIARAARRAMHSVHVAREDILAMLYRIEEAPGNPSISTRQARAAIGGGMLAAAALFSAVRRKELRLAGGSPVLTEAGRNVARAIVRTHRLWEHYMVHELGLRPDHVHDVAEKLEHVTAPRMRDELAEAAGGAERDPQGKLIPPR